VLLAQTNVSTSCAANSAWNGTTCAQYTVTPSAGANGTISPNTAQTVAYNTNRTFTVTPNSGYSASVAGTCGGSLVGTTYTTNAITANCTVVASFASTFSYSLTPSPSILTIIQGGQQSENIAVTLTAGSPQPVNISLSIPGAPSVTYNYANNGCNPTCSSPIVATLTVPSGVAPGSYPVTVNALTSGGSNTSFTLRVVAPVGLTVSVTPPSSVYVGNPVTWLFTASGGVGPYTFTCSGTDYTGSSFNGASPYSFNVTYQTVGTKTMTCNVVDFLGNTGSASGTVQVTINPNYIEF
jgi:hypothetical protein